MNTFFMRLVVLIMLFSVTDFRGELSAQGNGINCFVYHRFGDDRYPSTNIDTEVFEQHLRYLDENDYTVITFGRAIEILEGDTTIPEKLAVITIDDGYKTVFTNGFPLLKKYGFPATIFISSKQVGYGGQMNWEQIRVLKQSGIEIGMHSHSHAYFLDKPEKDVLTAFEKDLEECIVEFEINLDNVPEIYAYPFGEFSLTMKEVLKKHGVKAAAAQFSGVMSQSSDIYFLPRFPMNEDYGAIEGFKEKLAMRPLPLLGSSLKNPILCKSELPELNLKIDTNKINPNNLNCYWNGARNCEIERINGIELTISTDQSIIGRRGKFTITGPLKEKGWVWYSHPWFNPNNK